MKFKRWNCVMLLLLCFTLCTIAVTNYVVDPMGYFAFRSGDYEAVDFPVDTTYYQRLLKAKHIQYFGTEYDAFVIGGSKAGSYQPEKLSELDGYRYYNLYEAGGNVYEYELLVDLLIQYAAPKKIILNLSGGEVRKYQNSNEDLTFRVPAILDGTSEWKELVYYTFLDINKSISRIRERIDGKSYAELRADGSRNLEKYYKRAEADLEEMTQQLVLKPFAKHMQTLFETNRDKKYYQSCLDAMERIKQKCDAAGIELLVIAAPAFIGEMSEHDSSYYRDYLVKLADITDYWDFSGYNAIDMNPYNFYNEGHFYYEIADLMIDTIAGKTAYEDFGVYVTKENAQEHIAERTADYEALKAEYEATGTIQLPGVDSSYMWGDIS